MRIKFIILYIIIISLFGCASYSAGKQPESLLLESNNGNCKNIKGVFYSDGAIFRDGKSVSEIGNDQKIYNVFHGCIETPDCHLPTNSYDTQFFEISYENTTGLIVNFFDRKNNSLGKVKLTPPSLVCSPEGLKITLHSGMEQNATGSWGIGTEKKVILLNRDKEGKLVSRREDGSAGIFWFGLPYADSTGLWYVFDEKK